MPLLSDALSGAGKKIAEVIGKKDEETEEEFAAHPIPEDILKEVVSRGQKKYKGFKQIAGLDPNLRALFLQLRYALTHPSPDGEAEKGQVPMEFQSILLEGPTGTGKTTLGNALIKEGKDHAVKLDVDELISDNGWDMTSPNLMKLVFRKVIATAKEMEEDDQDTNDRMGASRRSRKSDANQNRTLVLFMDEADRFFPIRDGSAGLTNDALALWNELQQHDNIWVLAMTNNKKFMDSAAVRRFKIQETVKTPNQYQLADLISHYIGLIQHDAAKSKRNVVEDKLWGLVEQYNETSDSFSEYVNEHPKAKAEDDRSLAKKKKAFAEAAISMVEYIAPLTESAKGLAHADIAAAMEELARTYHIQFASAEGAEESGFNGVPARPIDLKRIGLALSRRQVRKEEFEEQQRQIQPRRG